MAITMTPPKTSQPISEPQLEQLTSTAPAPVIALDIEHLTKRFEVGGRKKKRKTVVAVNDVSLRIERGEIYGLLGANGSGKSTFIRLVSTLLTVENGRVAVFGHDIVRDEMAVKRLINRVSVDAAFFKKLSPYENLMYAARLYGISPGSTAKSEIVRILGRLGIAESRLGRPLEQMSRGMQQKVAVRACLPDKPRAASAGRADDRSRPALEARGPVVHRGDPRPARRDDPLDDARPRRGGAAVLAHRIAQRRPIGRRRHRERAQGRRRSPGGARRRPRAATLHDVFMAHTGRSLDDDVEESGEDDD